MGTSPLRRAREEVAVNIAVTGFVSKLLPTQTKDLENRLQGLNVRLRQQEKTLRDSRAALRKAQKEGDIAGVNQYTQAIIDQTEQIK